MAHEVRAVSRAGSYALAGALCSLGAPLGWLVLRGLPLVAVPGEVASHAGLYLYLTLGTALAFTAFGAVAGAFGDALAASNRALEHLAAFDALTGLRNARTFHVELERACAASRRHGRPTSLVMVDLDHFKCVNDAYGHAAGDEVLRHTATLLGGVARAADAAFRVGGEELALLCPDTEPAEAARLAERARLALESMPAHAEGKVIPVTASFGVAALGIEADPAELFRRADRALYAAKEGGRNRVVTAATVAASLAGDGQPQGEASPSAGRVADREGPAVLGDQRVDER